MGNWIAIANPEAEGDIRFPSAAIRAAPPEVLKAQGRRVMTRDREPAQCMLCGRSRPLSREHVPPRAAANAGEYFERDLLKDVGREALEPPRGGRRRQGGVWTRTLCEACNNATGIYADEYRGWAARGVRLLLDHYETPEVADSKSVTPILHVKFEDVRPGAFVRQVLSSLCSVSGPWDLAARYPEIRDMVLQGQVGKLPDGMAMAVGLYFDHIARYAGPTLWVNRNTEEWRWMLEVAFAPFILNLILAEEAQTPSPLCSVGEFLVQPPEVAANVELQMLVGFGHLGIPGDYRTRAQIEAGLDLDGSMPPSR